MNLIRPPRTGLASGLVHVALLVGIAYAILLIPGKEWPGKLGIYCLFALSVILYIRTAFCLTDLEHRSIQLCFGVLLALIFTNVLSFFVRISTTWVGYALMFGYLIVGCLISVKMMRFAPVRITTQFFLLIMLFVIFPLFYGRYLLKSKVMSDLYIQAKQITAAMEQLIQLM